MSDVQPVLSDLTIVELSDGIPGAYCGKLLAGLGARVINVEPPGAMALVRWDHLLATTRTPRKAARSSTSIPLTGHP